MSDNGLKRRERDLTVDKTMRVTTTLGFIVTLVVGVWFIGRWTDEIEDDSTLIRAEVRALEVLIIDVADRQRKYIGVEGLLTLEIDQAHHDIMAVREYLAAKYGEVLP